jgi:phage terminase large subunit-like protein
MYPSSQQGTSEFDTKWQQFLPRGEFKNHPKYGWKADIQQKQIKSIVWNTGVRMYFKSYSQKEVNLQSSSVHYIACDEECPENLYNELIFRLTATRGHFSNVFTATLGQDFWRRAMEPEEGEREVLPDAFKRTVSLYDCLKYADGTPSHWTLEDIKRIEDSCSTHNEVLKRVHGKFIKDVNGRKYPTFDIKKHVKGSGPIPFDWNIYSAVDVGSGGADNHPAAIVFIAVNQDLTIGRVFKAWRGDGIVTSAGDVFAKYLEMKAEIGRDITAQYYDFGSKDFDIISTRAGEAFIKAEKSHDLGEQIVNTVFKFGMLTIDEGDDELRKLAIELCSIPKEGPRKKKRDDLSDCLRYGNCGIPWDFSKTVLPIETGDNSEQEEKREAAKNRFGDLIVVRHDFEDGAQEGQVQSIESEFAELNELYGR